MLFARKALLLFVPAALSCVFLTAQRGNAPHAQPSAFVPARESLRQKALHEVVYEVRPDVTAVPPLLHVAVTFNATGPQGEAAALPETVSLQMPVWCPKMEAGRIASAPQTAGGIWLRSGSATGGWEPCRRAMGISMW